MTVVPCGMALPMGLPMRRRKYNGGSEQARAGRGMSSVKFRRIQTVKTYSKSYGDLSILTVHTDKQFRFVIHWDHWTIVQLGWLWLWFLQLRAGRGALWRVWTYKGANRGTSAVVKSVWKWVMRKTKGFPSRWANHTQNLKTNANIDKTETSIDDEVSLNWLK